MSDIEDTDHDDDDRAARIADLDDDAECESCACRPCECEPDVTTALGFEGSCEVCHEPVQVDQRVRVYADDVVVHERCPRPRAQA